MVNIFNILFTEIAETLEAEFPTSTEPGRPILVSGTALDSPQIMPCAAIFEIDNTTHQRTLDSARKEHHSRLHWQVEAYSNIVPGALAQAREIIRVIDDVLTKYAFVRIMCQPMDNIGGGITRIVARYTVVIGTDGLTFRN